MEDNFPNYKLKINSTLKMERCNDTTTEQTLHCMEMNGCMEEKTKSEEAGDWDGEGGALRNCDIVRNSTLPDAILSHPNFPLDQVFPCNTKRPIGKPCTSCGHPIRDRYALHVTPDLMWHVTCLCCVKCGKTLDEKITCYILAGKVYCREDYLRRKGIICHNCHLPFQSTDYVMRIEKSNNNNNNNNNNNIYKQNSINKHNSINKIIKHATESGYDDDGVIDTNMQGENDLKRRHKGIKDNTKEYLGGTEESVACGGEGDVGGGNPTGKESLGSSKSKNVNNIIRSKLKTAFEEEPFDGDEKNVSTNNYSAVTSINKENITNNNGKKRLIFHLHCFTCCVCGRLLRSGDHYTIDDHDRLYCIDDCVLSEEQYEPNAGSAFETHENSSSENKDFKGRLKDSVWDDYGGEEEGLEDGLVETSDNDSKKCVEEKIDSATNELHDFDCNDDAQPYKTSNTNSINIGYLKCPSRHSPTESQQVVFNSALDNNATSFQPICSQHVSSKESSLSEDLLDLPATKMPEETNKKQITSSVSSHQPPRFKSGKSSQHVAKTTRVRTVLNEKQLHMLKTCYAANPRPDALMKDQLVEMTGLNSRVIRVWFQNKRCKDKKRTFLIKKIQQHNHEKMKHMITVAPQTSFSDDSHASVSLDVEKNLNSSHLESLNTGWSIDLQGYSQSQYQHSRPIYHSLPGPSQPINEQCPLLDANPLTPRFCTPPIQQLLNSFGSSRNIHSISEPNNSHNSHNNNNYNDAFNETHVI